MAAYPIPPFQPGARQMRGTSGLSPWHWVPLGEWGWAKATTGPVCRSASHGWQAWAVGYSDQQIVVSLGKQFWRLKWGLGPRAGWGAVVSFVARF